MAMIDLRSDTVTKPSEAMRAAMAAAEVGDDVYGEDPSVNQLQRQVAELLGTEAALFVPSGTMANQLALGACTRPGDEIIVGDRAHNWLFETGAAAAINGVQHCVIPGSGIFGGDEVRDCFKPDNHHHSPSRVVSLENTHNMSGGRLWPRERLDDVLAAAKELGLVTHLDGARLWNAAAATQSTPASLCQGFDLVSVCLSKGLGAPVGSLVCGKSEHIHQAHRLRKMLGGGMRQAGILAAAGTFALEHNLDRLSEDHRRARALAEGIARQPLVSVDLNAVETNIIVAEIRGPLTAESLVTKASERGVLVHAIARDRIRLVTHLDIDDNDVVTAIAVFEDIARAE